MGTGRSKILFASTLVFLLLPAGRAWAKDAPLSRDAKAWKAIQKRAQGNISGEANIKMLGDFIRAYPQSGFAPDARFIIAEMLFAKTQYREASPQYDLLVKQRNPVYQDDALLRLGEIHYNNGDIPAARGYWKKIISRVLGRTVLSAETLYGLVLCDLRENDYLSASQKLEHLERQFPAYTNLAKARELTAVIHFQKKNYHKTVEAVEDINTPTATFYRGLSYYHLKQYLEAAQAFEKLFALAGGTYSEIGGYFKAESFRMAGNSPLAARSYSAFIRRCPSSRLVPYAQVQLAKAVFNLKNNKKAMQILASVTAMPGLAGEIAAYARYLEASIFSAEGNHQAAIASLDSALKFVNKAENPDIFGNIYVAKGYYLLKNGDLKGASDVMNHLVQEMPYHPLGPAACLILGNAAYMRGDWSAALTSYETALLKYKYTELSDVALAMLLKTYYKAGRFQELVTNANRIMKLIVSEFPAQNAAWRTYAYFLLAEAYYNIKQYPEASMYYRKAMQNYKWLPSAQFCLAWSRYHEENYPEAIALARTVMASGENSPEEKSSAAFLIGASLFNQKQYGGAIEAFRRLRKRFPGDKNVPESYFQEGMALKQSRYFKDALIAWSRLITLFPDNVLAQEGMLQMGRLYFQGRSYEKAVKAFSAFAEKWPASEFSAEANWLMAQSYYNAKNYDEAITGYEGFLRKFPKDYRAEDGKNQLMQSYYNRAMFKKEPELLSQFVKMYPKSDLAAEAQYQLGYGAYVRKDWVSTVKELRALLLNYPGTAQAPMALLAVGHSEEYLKRLDAAVEEYESLLSLFPSTQYAIDGAMRLGAIYFSREKYKDAARKFQFLADHTHTPEVRADAVYNMAVCHKRSQSYVDALAAYEMLVKDYPGDERQLDALLEIADIHAAEEEHQKTVDAYNRVLASKNKKLTSLLSMDVCVKIGDIFIKYLNNKDKAVVAYSQLIPMKPEKYDSRLVGLAQLAAIYEERGDWKKALAVYGGISKSGGRNDWVGSAAARLKEIKEYLRASGARQVRRTTDEEEPKDAADAAEIARKPPAEKEAAKDAAAFPADISSGEKSPGVVLGGEADGKI
ncbi:MAG TPA: hypothetical protein DCZ93_11320 [Elusimicrobia bacterium]|nr:hypothetical protein [Elusimicrobiota bacterium]